jgi:hypothetical protein
MKPESRPLPEPNNRARPVDQTPDTTKCKEKISREMPGATPGDRGMCEKASETQGSE